MSAYIINLPDKAMMIYPISHINTHIPFKSDINSKKEKKISTPMKVGIGTLSALAVTSSAVLIRRKAQKPMIWKVQEDLSRIFGREFTLDETRDLADKYKRIYHNRNTATYITELNKQLKEDFGYKNTNITLNIDGTLGAWDKVNGRLHVTPADQKTHDRVLHRHKRDIFVTMVHEYTHVKQSEIAYRTSPEELNKALIKRNYNANLNDKYSPEKELLEKMAREQNLTLEEAKEKRLEELYNSPNEYRLKWMDEAFGNMEKFQPYTEEYMRGLSYIEENGKYVSAEQNFAEYRKNWLEEEAYLTAPFAKEIFRYITPIFR